MKKNSKKRKGRLAYVIKWLRKKGSDWVAYVVVKMLGKMWGF